MSENISMVAALALFTAWMITNMIWSSDVAARTYCPPADPENIPYMRGTAVVYRQYCPRTVTQQTPYCPAPGAP